MIQRFVVMASWVFGFEEGSIGYPWLCTCLRILAGGGDRVERVGNRRGLGTGASSFGHFPAPASTSTCRGCCSCRGGCRGEGGGEATIDINGLQPSSSHFVDWMGLPQVQGKRNMKNWAEIPFKTCRDPLGCSSSVVRPETDLEDVSIQQGQLVPRAVGLTPETLCFARSREPVLAA